jgi:hypothetical protein
VFRGFHATPAGRGGAEYEFLWLLRRPMRAAFDAPRARLTYRALFPGVRAGSPMAADLQGVVAARTGRRRPAHQRIDGRRLRLTSRLHRGDWSLEVTIRGANHAHGVRATLGVVNELYLTLLERYPDYLVERFGLSPE